MKTLTYDVSKFEAFDHDTIMPSFFAVVVGQRRSGKSFMVNHLLQKLTKDKSKKPDAIFLISRTLGTDVPSFEGIPPSFRFPNMDVLEKYIIPKQIEVRDHNRQNKNKKFFTPVKSNVVVVIDDFAVDNMLKNKTLEELAKNGRHFSGTHGSLSIILLTQSLTAVARQIRLNLDFLFFNALSSIDEANMIMRENGFFSMDTSKKGTSAGRELYHNLVSMQDFRFIVLENYKQNKKDYPDYIKYYDAEYIKPFKFFGGKMDWINDDFFISNVQHKTEIKHGGSTSNIKQKQNIRKPSARLGATTFKSSRNNNYKN
jgi:hypothetical protein